jgi:hypothetical protein
VHLGGGLDALGEIGDADGIAAAEDDGALDDVAKLAEVAGPGVFLEGGLRLGREASEAGLPEWPAKKASMRARRGGQGISGERVRSRKEGEGGMVREMTLSR